MYIQQLIGIYVDGILFDFIEKKGGDMKTPSGVLTMELTTEMAELLRDLFDIGTEMMQGKVEPLRNNMKRYTIQIPGSKGQRIKDFILKAIANKEQQLSLN
jgi:hypothetical protein